MLAWGRGGTAAALEEAGFTLGEGPGRDCVSAGAPVLVADLSDAVARWPAFAPAALDLGVRAMFALPLRVGAISVGTLVAHRHTPGSLRDGQLVDALALADTLTVLLLRRATGEPARTIAEGGQPPPGWAPPATHRLEVHQATGMISVQLGVGLAEALVRLRAHAYGNDRPIAEVAADAGPQTAPGGPRLVESIVTRQAICCAPSTRAGETYPGEYGHEPRTRHCPRRSSRSPTRWSTTSTSSTSCTPWPSAACNCSRWTRPG